MRSLKVYMSQRAKPDASEKLYKPLFPPQPDHSFSSSSNSLPTMLDNQDQRSRPIACVKRHWRRGRVVERWNREVERWKGSRESGMEETVWSVGFASATTKGNLNYHLPRVGVCNQRHLYIYLPFIRSFIQSGCTTSYFTIYTTI